MGDPFNVLRCNVRDWSLSSRMSLPLYIASCRQATRRSQVIAVTQQDLEAKKKRSPILYSSFSLSRYLFSLAMWC